MFFDESLDGAFFGRQRSADLPFVLNDTVVMTDGKRKGGFAAVISVHLVNSERKYLVEYTDGSDEWVPESWLKFDSPGL